MVIDQIVKEIRFKRTLVYFYLYTIVFAGTLLPGIMVIYLFKKDLFDAILYTQAFFKQFLVAIYGFLPFLIVNRRMTFPSPEEEMQQMRNERVLFTLANWAFWAAMLLYVIWAFSRTFRTLRGRVIPVISGVIVLELCWWGIDLWKSGRKKSPNETMKKWEGPARPVWRATEELLREKGTRLIGVGRIKRLLVSLVESVNVSHKQKMILLFVSMAVFAAVISAIFTAAKVDRTKVDYAGMIRYYEGGGGGNTVGVEEAGFAVYKGTGVVGGGSSLSNNMPELKYKGKKSAITSEVLDKYKYDFKKGEEVERDYSWIASVGKWINKGRSRKKEKSTPLEHSLWNGLGEEALENTRLDKAERYFKMVLQAVPEDPRARKNLGKLYCEIGAALVGQGDYKKAVQYFTKAIKMDPSSEQAKSYLGKLKRD